MVYEIILGREKKDRETYGTRGTVLIGKQYVKMGAVTTLSQPVYLDCNKAHVIFVCGKRGSGKSYSLAVIAEGISKLEEEYRKRISVIMLDTMGIYWTMKYPNNQDTDLLNEWGYEGSPINSTIYTPYGYYETWKNEGIPTDKPFAINPAELNPEDWNLTFELEMNDPLAVFIERVILDLKDETKEFGIEKILEKVKAYKENENVKQAAINRFESVKRWGLFSTKATQISDIAKPGQVSVLDLSAYALQPHGWKIKHLVIGILSMKLFVERMKERKKEEFEIVNEAIHFIKSEETRSKMPIVWLMIDEAHEFLPAEGKTASTNALVTLLREGRQPGIAMVLATQQPGKIHTDAMTQSDIILAHRLTAKIDTDALGNLMQSYLRTGLDKDLQNLPRVPGACLAVDDTNENIYPLRIRPRFSWHGGSAPRILK